jgi:hypothetical protein
LSTCGFTIQPGRAIEIDRARVMLAALHGIEPVAVDEVAVGIEIAEEGIGDGRFPNVVA